jgi:hypothetical protein
MACIQHLGFSDLPTIYNISYPVGPNMPNVRDDVLLIQTLMKLANFTTRSDEDNSVEASNSINVDGWFSEQTKRMIEAFEGCVREKHLLLAADGLFEPSSNNGYNSQGVIYKIIHLNRLAKQTAACGNKYNEIPTDPETDPVLRQSLLTNCNPDLEPINALWCMSGRR